MISDEVYALSVYDTGATDLPTFTSALSIDPTGLIEAERLHIFYGMSKVNTPLRFLAQRQLLNIIFRTLLQLDSVSDL